MSGRKQCKSVCITKSLLKEYHAFVSLTLDINDTEDVKIVSINAPKEVLESGNFNPTESLSKISCWSVKCVVIAIINWFNSLFD